MQIKKGQVYELEVKDLGARGKGVASLEGFKVFVDGTAPGDKVEAQLVKKKRKYGEGKLLNILQPSKDRISARCEHFDTCGGCKWQFLSYEKQLEVKEGQVREALVRLAGLDRAFVDDVFEPIVPCSEPWFYRNKMELSFGPGQDGVMLGFYPPGYHYEVFDLKACYLMEPYMASLTAYVRDFARLKGLDFFDSKTGEGLLRNLLIRSGKNTGELLVALVVSPAEFAALDTFVEHMKAWEFEGQKITSLYLQVVHQQKGSPTRIEQQLLGGKAVLRERLSELEFDILPQAFFQTNTRQAEVLYGKVLELAVLSGTELVYDLYCGTGTIGLFCAGSSKEVIGVDINAASIENAKSNAELNQIKNASYHCGDVDKVLEGVLSGERAKPDIVIVDPPRNGLGESVVKKVADFGARRVVYVSCNPSTLARDLKDFAELGWKLVSCQPVDMFPQTYHVEVVSVLERRV